MRYVTCEEISLNKPDHQLALHLGLAELNTALGSSAEASRLLFNKAPRQVLRITPFYKKTCKFAMCLQEKNI